MTDIGICSWNDTLNNYLEPRLFDRVVGVFVLDFGDHVIFHCFIAFTVQVGHCSLFVLAQRYGLFGVILHRIVYKAGRMLIGACSKMWRDVDSGVPWAIGCWQRDVGTRIEFHLYADVPSLWRYFALWALH